MPETRDPLLVEREKTHGSWPLTAAAASDIRAAIQKWDTRGIPSSQMEALHMIAMKIARALQHPKNKDHWDDIAGYAKLASEACDK